MSEATRTIVAGEMSRMWLMVSPTIAPDYDFTGSAAEAVSDFLNRFPNTTILSWRLVQDDGDWTIRITFGDHSVATVFVAD